MSALGRLRRRLAELIHPDLARERAAIAADRERFRVSIAWLDVVETTLRHAVTASHAEDATAPGGALRIERAAEARRCWDLYAAVVKTRPTEVRRVLLAAGVPTIEARPTTCPEAKSHA